jgi:tripartite-type tricarboxylate transporter receptor subunit TctC
MKCHVPVNLVARIQRDVAQILATPDTATGWSTWGSTIVAKSPAEFAAFLAHRNGPLRQSE